MRLYGRKIFERALARTVNRRQGESEGVLWSVDEESQTCTVKMQGSNNQIVCHYPRNQKNLPTWLREGNAVRISHKRGDRNYASVIGPGRAVPNPVTGGQFPALGTLGDTWITAIKLTVLEDGSDIIAVSPVGAQYRISGTTYTVPEGAGNIEMGNPGFPDMGEYPAPLVGAVYLTLPDNPASTYYFRYDAVVIGIDGEIDIIQGTQAHTSPAKPAVPVGHILIDYILRIGDTTGTKQVWVGATWSTPIPKELSVDAEEELSYSEITDYPEFTTTVRVKDQYGRNLSNDEEWQISGQLIYGTGQLWSADSGYSDYVEDQTYSSSLFRYQRNQPLGNSEKNPISVWRLSYGNYKLTAVLVQKLLPQVA